MNRFFLLFSFFIVTVLGIVGCKSEVFEEEHILRLSSKELSFTPKGGKQHLLVETSEKTWSAFVISKDSWLTLEEHGNELDITAAPNAEAAVRNAQIVVVSSGISTIVKVTQNAGEETLQLSKEEINFGHEGGDTFVDVDTNYPVFTCEPEVPTDWIHLTIDTKNKNVRVTVESVNTELKRTVKLIVKTGNVMKQIVVSQEGLSKFYLPFYPKDMKGDDLIRGIMEYEKLHQNNYVAYTPIEDLYLTFFSHSNLFGEITYTIASDKSHYKSVSTSFSSKDKKMVDAYKLFLVENHFVKDVDNSNESKTVYEQPEENLVVELLQKENGLSVIFKYSQPQPTFKEYPFIESKFFSPSWKIDQITAYEESKKHNSLPMKDWGDGTIDYSFSTDYDGVNHYYTEDSGKDKQIVEEGLTLSLKGIPWVFTGNEKSWTVSREFEKMIRKQGYVYDSAKGNTKTYVNKVAGRKMVFGYFKKNIASVRVLPLS